jgi:lysozyme family protein
MEALSRLGMLKTGLDAPAAIQKLLSFLVLQGFVKGPDAKPGGQPVEDAAKLAEMLKQLQAKEGLPQTGKLDEKTLKTLEKYKPATSSGERATERQAAPQDLQQAARMAASFRENSLAAWIKSKTTEMQPKPSAQTPHQTSDARQAAQHQ